MLESRRVAEFMFGFHVAAVPVTDTDNLNDYRLVLHKTFVYPGYRRAVRTLRPGSTKRVSQSWLAGWLLNKTADYSYRL